MLDACLSQAYPKALATLIRVLGNLDRAEDSLQEACLKAAERWSQDGPPENPVAWLVTTARNHWTDEYRRGRTWAGLEIKLMDVEEAQEKDWQPLEDDLLRLVCVCCHPSLAVEVQIALTLKTIIGLSVEEIARAFLIPVKTMEQRLTRAKKKIESAGIPYQVPEAKQLAERLDAILTVAYLIYNEGYEAYDDQDNIRPELSRMALSLTAQLIPLFPKQPEVAGLHALMLGHQARIAARLDTSGKLVSLEKQDRRHWNQTLIQQADQFLTQALHFGQVGPYQLQAAIVAVHNHALHYQDTDWQQILILYNLLLEHHPTEVVRLNRAIALWQSQGNTQGAWEELHSLEASLSHYFPYQIACAHLSHADGDLHTAHQHLLNASELTCKPAEYNTIKDLQQQWQNQWQ